LAPAPAPHGALPNGSSDDGFMDGAGGGAAKGFHWVQGRAPLLLLCPLVMRAGRDARRRGVVGREAAGCGAGGVQGALAGRRRGGSRARAGSRRRRGG
jgi:hypothetical protein